MVEKCMVSCLSCREIFWPAEWVLDAAALTLCKGRWRKERRKVQRSCFPTWCLAPITLQGQAATPPPGSCQKCLNLHAINNWQSLPFKLENQGLTNLMQKVVCRPTWLLLVTPIFFYLSHLPLRAFCSCGACCSASITEIIAAKNPLSLLPTPAFLFSPQAAPCSVLALTFKRQLAESDGGTAGLRNNSTERKS